MSIHFLQHHGVQGQKWGERHGPPYPLDSNKAVQAQRKANYTPESEHKFSKSVGSQRDLDKAAKLKTKASKYDVKAANYKAKSAKALTKNQNQTAAKFYLKSAKAEKASAKANLKAEKLIDKDKREKAAKKSYKEMTSEELADARRAIQRSLFRNSESNRQKEQEIIQEEHYRRSVKEDEERAERLKKETTFFKDISENHDNDALIYTVLHYTSVNNTSAYSDTPNHPTAYHLYHDVRDSVPRDYEFMRVVTDKSSKELNDCVKYEIKAYNKMVSEFDKDIDAYKPTKSQADFDNLISRMEKERKDPNENEYKYANAFTKAVLDESGDWYEGTTRSYNSAVGSVMDDLTKVSRDFQKYSKDADAVKQSKYLFDDREGYGYEGGWDISALMDLGYPVTKENMKKIHDYIYWD